VARFADPDRTFANGVRKNRFLLFAAPLKEVPGGGGRRRCGRTLSGEMGGIGLAMIVSEASVAGREVSLTPGARGSFERKITTNIPRGRTGVRAGGGGQHEGDAPKWRRCYQCI